MPRNYIKSLRKPLKKYDKAKILEAVEAIKSGQLNFRQASQHFGISVGVLYRHKKADGNGEQLRIHGGQPVLSPEEEQEIVKYLKIAADWGYLCTPVDLRIIIKGYLNGTGRIVKRFKNNTPGLDFTYRFMQRHGLLLSTRLCPNVKRSRAFVSRSSVQKYFENLKVTLEGVPPENIVNYDETNLTDEPGRKTVIVKRRCKYPERFVNSSKTSTSVMFAAAGDGCILPPYVVYKSQHLFDTTCTEGGPEGCIYNKNKSGWFDAKCFEDWMRTVALPYLRKKSGKKVLVGDNLSSHMSWEIIAECLNEDIHFAFLPPNSTHLCQVLDVAFSAPLKKIWRAVLEEWKMSEVGQNCSSVPKADFPRLLKELMEKLAENGPTNVINGFRKCGIVPFNPDEVLERLPGSRVDLPSMETSFEPYLLGLRYGGTNDDSPARRIKSHFPVSPGSVTVLVEGEGQLDYLDAGPSKCCHCKVVRAIHTGRDESSSDYEELMDGPADDISITSSVGQSDNEYDGDSPAQTFEQAYSIWQWVLVRFNGKKAVKHYVGQIVSIMDNGDLTVRFVRKFGKNHFKWPPNEDISEVERSEVISVLPDPTTLGNRERVSLFHFDMDFEDLSIN